MKQLKPKFVRSLGKKGMAKMSLNKKWGIGGIFAVGVVGTLAVLATIAGVNYASTNWFGGSAVSSSIGASDDATAQPVVLGDTREGVSATANFDFYDVEADTLTQVYPGTIWVKDSTGTILSNGGLMNSTTTVRGEQLSLFVGGTDYYGDAYDLFSVTTEAPTFKADVHAMSAEASMQVKGYDSDGIALTADDNTNNTADYSVSMGADEVKTVYVKLVNNQADKLYQAGAICTFSSMNTTGTADFEIIEAGWTEVDVPREMDNAALSIAADDSTGSFTQTGYDRCYVPDASVIKLDEYAELKLKAKITAGATNPAANTGNNVGALFVDAAYEDDKDGNIVLDFYKHDKNEQVTAVGLSDTTTSPQGLTTGVVIELQ